MHFVGVLLLKFTLNTVFWKWEDQNGAATSEQYLLLHLRWVGGKERRVRRALCWRVYSQARLTVCPCAQAFCLLGHVYRVREGQMACLQHLVFLRAAEVAS